MKPYDRWDGNAYLTYWTLKNSPLCLLHILFCRSYDKRVSNAYWIVYSLCCISQNMQIIWNILRVMRRLDCNIYKILPIFLPAKFLASHSYLFSISLIMAHFTANALSEKKVQIPSGRRIHDDSDILECFLRLNLSGISFSLCLRHLEYASSFKPSEQAYLSFSSSSL